MTDNPSLPSTEWERFGAVYEELQAMTVRLDPNPIEYGPQRFNNRIAAVRSMLNRVEQLFLQTSEDWHVYKRVINAKKTLYELEKRELMVKDPRCRVGRSQGEREALADVELRSQIEEISHLEQSASDLETLMISIKAKRSDLKDTQGRMRDQMKMIDHDLGMGARWGRKAAPPPTLEESQNVADQAQDIDDMLRTMDQKMGYDESEEENNNNNNKVELTDENSSENEADDFLNSFDSDSDASHEVSEKKEVKIDDLIQNLTAD
jgi:hypothetical protein